MLKLSPALTAERARLWLTLANVLTLAALALAALLLGWPRRLVTDGTLRAEWLAMLWPLAIWLALSLPFDLIGGWGIARWTYLPAPVTPAVYLRGIVTHGVLMWLVAGILLAAGRLGCLSGVLSVVVLLMMAQLRAQVALARLTGSLRRVERDLGPEARLLHGWGLRVANVTVLAADDPAFCGGFSGLPQRARLVLPAHWLDTQSSEYAAVQIIRRAGALKDFSRWRGVVIGALFNVGGLALAALVPGGGFGSAAALTTTLCAFTLWSVAGHLFWLPTLSRLGVLESDRFAARKGLPKRLLARTFATSDQLAAVDAERPQRLELLFYAVPSQNTRLEHLRARRGWPGAWHAQQMALYLSWACCGPLARAVGHSIGRPQLWALPYGD